MDEKVDDPFQDYGPSLVGNIFYYSNSTKDEGEVEKRQNDKEDSGKEEVRIAKEKSKADMLKDTWKSVIQESMFMPHLKKIVIEFDKVCFQHDTNESFVHLLYLLLQQQYQQVHNSFR